MTYTGKVYKDNNGDRMVVDNGGSINFKISTVTATSLTLTQALYDSRTIFLNSATGQTITLPAATGSGARYKFIQGQDIASGFTTIKVANTSDAMAGVAVHTADGGDTVTGYETTSGTDTITMNGSSTGGKKGAKIVLEDVAENLYYVQVIGAASGTEATPFSATV